MEELKYPIGKYIQLPFSKELKMQWLASILDLPLQLEYAVTNLDEAQLDTPYRDGGWTVKQVVHHVADSHMNAFIRTKLALTELTTPTITPYNQDAWVELADCSNVPVNISLTLLHSLHRRWYELMKDLPEASWNLAVYHPQYKKEMTIWYILGLYAWHGQHHSAHINKLRERKGW